MSSNTNTMKIPTKAATRKASLDKVVEDIKGNLPADVNHPSIVYKPPTKSDREAKITPINGESNVVDVIVERCSSSTFPRYERRNLN